MVSCLVTGASGALGKELVQLIASKNATIIAIVRVDDDCFSQPNVKTLSCDLESPGDVTAMCTQLKFEHVDVIVMNAALGPASQKTPSSIIQVNVLSHLELMRTFPRARVVCISSRAVDDPWTGCLNSDVYAASKSALESLARSRENEIGLPCHSLVVSAMESKMLREIVGDEYTQPILNPRDVARECGHCIFLEHHKRRIIIDADRPNKMVTFRREYEFSASHQLRDTTLSALQNEENYGKCHQLHGHNYRFQVEVKGPIDDFGCVINSHQLDTIVRTNILDTYDHSHLNDLIPFTTHAPTVERIAAHIHTTLDKALHENNLSLQLSVKVQETRRNSACVQ